MFCNKCGAQASDDSLFCEKCGNSLKNVTYTATNNSPQPVMLNTDEYAKKSLSARTVLIIAIGVIIVVIAVVLGAIMNKSNTISGFNEIENNQAAVSESGFNEIENSQAAVSDEDAIEVCVTDFFDAFFKEDARTASKYWSTRLYDEIITINPSLFSDVSDAQASLIEFASHIDRITKIDDNNANVYVSIKVKYYDFRGDEAYDEAVLKFGMVKEDGKWLIDDLGELLQR